MPAASAGRDLEVVADPVPVDVRSGRRPAALSRWAAAAIVLVVAVGLWLVFPARSGLSRSEVRRLEAQWLAAESLDNGRFAVMDKLNAAAVPSDDARVRAADAALYREEADTLDAIHRAVHADLLADSGLWRLRTAMDRALTDQRADQDRLARWYTAPAVPDAVPPGDRSVSTVAAIDDAYRLLDAELRRFRLTPRPLPAAPHFGAADITLSYLSHIADTPTRTRLVVVTEDGMLELVDIDANRITPAHLAGLSPAFQAAGVLARRSYVVVSDPDGPYYIAPPDLQGQAQPLAGPGSTVVAAVDADAVWLQQPNGTMVEQDGQGRVLLGPVRFPGQAILSGAVDAGLVLTVVGRGGVEGPLIVWNPTSRTTVRTLTAQPSGVMAVDHDLVVWLGGDPASPSYQVAHLTTVSTGVDRTVASVPHLVPTGDQWSVSPDGTTVASVWWTKGQPPDAIYAPAFINVSTGRFTLAPVALPAPSPNTIEWADAGDRVFLTSYNAGFGTPSIMTYRLGTETIEQLRLPKATNIVASAVVLTVKTPRQP